MAKKKPAKRQQEQPPPPDAAADGSRPGRPPGSPNHDYSVEVIVRGVACAHCGSGDVTVVARGESSAAAGITTERHKMVCGKCGRRFMRLTRVPACSK